MTRVATYIRLNMTRNDQCPVRTVHHVSSSSEIGRPVAARVRFGGISTLPVPVKA